MGRVVKLPSPIERHPAGKKDVRNAGLPANLTDGGDTTSLSQSRIEDHEIGAVPRGGRQRPLLRFHDFTNVMPHPAKHFGQEHRYSGIIFRDHDA